LSRPKPTRVVVLIEEEKEKKKIIEISCFMKIRPMRAEMFHAD
jgi:hypothetical protein